MNDEALCWEEPFVNPPFDTIEIGPLATNYHREQVDERFLEAFEAFLHDELLPQATIAYDRTEGILKPCFN